MKNILETKTYLTKEINQNELMNKKHEKFDRALSYIELLPIPTSSVSGRLSISLLYL